MTLFFEYLGNSVFLVNAAYHTWGAIYGYRSIIYLSGTGKFVGIPKNIQLVQHFMLNTLIFL